MSIEASSARCHVMAHWFVSRLPYAFLARQFISESQKHLLPSPRYFFTFTMFALANVRSGVLVTRFTGAEQEPHKLHARKATATGESRKSTASFELKRAHATT